MYLATELTPYRFFIGAVYDLGWPSSRLKLLQLSAKSPGALFSRELIAYIKLFFSSADGTRYAESA
jgi:hypothetical protein